MATIYSSLTVLENLGVHMDIDLTFTEHNSKIVNTSHSRAALILKCIILEILKC